MAIEEDLSRMVEVWYKALAASSTALLKVAPPVLTFATGDPPAQKEKNLLPLAVCLPKLVSDESANSSTHRITMEYDHLETGILTCVGFAKVLIRF
ncbi:MAG: hypothetical protein HWN68_10630 [Desulfobacterales bacterium]|nr:hypothetical protein [Desulfobacterales bacterium]